MLNNNASIAFESKITFKTKCNEEAIYFLKKDFSRKVFIIKDNVHKKERRILWNGNCREKRHSVVKIIIKHICQRLLTFKLLLRDDSERLSKPNRHLKGLLIQLYFHFIVRFRYLDQSILLTNLTHVLISYIEHVSKFLYSSTAF